MSDPTQMTLKDLAVAIRRRKVSSLEVTKALLAAAARVALAPDGATRIARAVTPMLTRFAAAELAMPLETEPSSFVAVQHRDAAR